MKKEVTEQKHDQVDAPDHATCFHCGDQCREVIPFDDKTFCCQGCVTVYDMLSTSGLGDYYALNSSPGTKAKDQRYEYLGNEQIVAQLLDFDSEKIAKITLFIPSIHCSSCIWLLENLAQIVPGIQHSQVYFIKKKLSITYHKDDVSLQQIVTFLGQIGYDPEINLASKKESDSKKTRSSLGIKIGVAGFCFGNAMFLSLPDYLDQNFLLDDDFKYYFGIISILLALPVLFYSATDYFKSAWGGLRKRFVNIDVPIALGITTLFVRSIYEIVQGTGTGYLDSMNGLVFFLLVGRWFQNKTYQSLSFERDFKSFFPVAVERKVSDQTEFVQVEEIKEGDLIVIHNDEILPVDGILASEKGKIDYSFVTGEAVAEEKQKGDLLYAGGRHAGPPIQVKVSKEISSSYLTSLWNQDAFANDKDLGFQNSINKISNYFTFIVLGLALASGLFWYFVDASQIWQVVTSVLIVACPCALALSVPFAYGHTMRFLGRQKFFLKNADVVEKLSRISQIVFDKTGTLTSSKQKGVIWEGVTLTDEEKNWVAAMASNSFHPYSRQICQWLAVPNIADMQEFEEKTGKGIVCAVPGHSLQLGSASFCGVKKPDDQSASYLMIDGKLRGRFVFESGYREGIFDMLKVIRGGAKLHLLSGDKPTEQKRLSPYFDALSFEQKPEDKLAYMEQCENVLMLGDGLNDAGALRIADVGVAVAEDVHQFSPSCDAILRGDQLPQLHKFLQMSSFAMKIVYTAFGLSFLYNLLGVSFAVSGHLTPLLSAVLMPISSVTVVGFITAAIAIKAKMTFRDNQD